MVELLVTNYKGIDAFGNVASQTVPSTNSMVFLGDRFETEPALKLAKNILMDIFQGPGDAGEPQGRRPRHHLHRPRE